jgi:Na+/melibiose symporter-like transporter
MASIGKRLLRTVGATIAFWVLCIACMIVNPDWTDRIIPIMVVPVALGIIGGLIFLLNWLPRRVEEEQSATAQTSLNPGQGSPEIWKRSPYRRAIFWMFFFLGSVGLLRSVIKLVSMVSSSRSGIQAVPVAVGIVMGGFLLVLAFRVRRSVRGNSD